MSDHVEVSEIKDELGIGEALRNSFDKEGPSVSDELMTATLEAIRNGASSDAALWNIAEDTEPEDEPLYDVGYKVAELAEEELLSLESEVRRVVEEEVSDTIDTADPERRHIWKPDIIEGDDVRDKSAAKVVAIAGHTSKRRRSKLLNTIRIAGTAVASIAIIGLAWTVIRSISPGDKAMMADVAASTASLNDNGTGQIVDLRTKTTSAKATDGYNDMEFDDDEAETETASLYADGMVSPSAAGGSTENMMVGVPNPLVITDEEGIYNRLGFVMRVPDNAEDIVFYLLGDSTAEERFLIDGTQYTVRAACANAMIDISGMYYTWDDSLTETWKEDNTEFAVYMTTERDAGVCLMYDSEAGIMFTISSQGNCSVAILRDLVEEIHVTL